MAPQSVMIPITPQKGQPCPCGCAPCQSACCNLSCLERPRFFCGQLLTDQDLTALVGWTQDKLRLTRYRDGWGVVCGLDVRCAERRPSSNGNPPQGAATVIVGPGYAVSCCGDDIIVCEDAPIDLSAVCADDQGPCAQPSASETIETKVQVGCIQIPGRELRTVDLFIAYCDELADPQTALGRSACKEVAQCEYGRTREVFTLTWRPVTDDSTPPQDRAAAEWRSAYEACTEACNELLDGPTPVKLKAWLADHPPHDFSFLYDCVCKLQNDGDISAQQLFWRIQDCRNAFLRCECHSCAESTGVPLARVWLKFTLETGKRRCSVLRIDAYPPYRRPISRDCWPAPMGEVNVARAIWHRVQDATCLLTSRGLQVSVDFDLFPIAKLDRGWLTSSLACPPFVSCGSRVVLKAILLGDGDQRVVAVCPVEVT